MVPPRLARLLPALLALALVPAHAGCPGKSTQRGADRPGDSDSNRGPADREAILAASDLPTLQPEPLPGDPMAVTVHRLSNGITVYLSTDRQQPRFTGWIAVRTGSRNDPADSTGLAHYLEHMLFKGTRTLGTTDYQREKAHIDKIAGLYDELRRTKDATRRSAILAEIDRETQRSAAFAIPNELDQLYAALGIQGVNAFTGTDQTVYIADVPANKLEHWARIEGNRFRSPEFRLFWPELEAVYEEKNRSLDNPEWRMHEAMNALLFPRHPYGTQTTIGTVEHLKTPAYGDMVAYFRRWYLPNNMAIVLAGDIDASAALPVLERAFAGMEPRPLAPVPSGELGRLTRRVEHTIEAEGEQGLYIAWPTVAGGHPDRVALEVMDLLVDNAQSGLINLELVLTQKLPRAGSGASFMTEAGFWLMHATARAGQPLEEAEALLLGVVSKLKAGEFRQEDLDAIVLSAEIQDKQGLESSSARVNRMAEAYTERVPWAEMVGRLDRMRAVTREDVVRVANRYLGDGMVVVKRTRGRFEPPKMDKPAITPIELDTARESALAREVKQIPVRPLEPEWLVEGTHYERHPLPAGPLIASRNPRHDLFTIRYRFALGSKRKRLLCHALELLDRSGARGLPAAELKRTLFAMGTEVHTRCDRDETEITVNGIDRNMKASVELLDRWLRTAEFEAQTVDQLAANRVSQRKDEMDEPRVIAAALAEYAMRGADSSYLVVPSNRELRAAKGKALGALLAALPDHQHRTTYFGPRTAAEAAPIIALGKRHRKLATRPFTRYRKGKGTRVYLVDRKVAQSQVRIMVAKPPLAPAERALARLYSEYVGGGMGALVFQEIREARGLAYSAWASYSRGVLRKDESALVGGLGTQSDKTLEAITTLLGLLRQMPIEERRFEVARSALDEEYRSSRADPRAAPGWVLTWDDMGEPVDPRPRDWSALKALAPNELAGFGSRAASGPTVISLLGNTARFDRQELSKLGAIETVPIQKLFGY
jgi:predicted Zn-dependent peptidase